MILIATSLGNLVKFIEQVETSSQEIRLKLYPQKNKIMVIDRENKTRPDLYQIADSKFEYHVSQLNTMEINFLRNVFSFIL